MADQILVCRRVEDTTFPPSYGQVERFGECSECQKPLYVEDGTEDINPKVCLHCAAQNHPEAVIFVELPPDEYGNRSMAKGVTEVFQAGGGDWHKSGVWHSQQWVLARQG